MTVILEKFYEKIAANLARIIGRLFFCDFYNPKDPIKTASTSESFLRFMSKPFSQLRNRHAFLSCRMDIVFFPRFSSEKRSYNISILVKTSLLQKINHSTPSLPKIRP